MIKFVELLFSACNNSGLQTKLCIWIKRKFDIFFSALKEVQMKVNPYTRGGGCGGGTTTAKIMINVFNTANITHYDSMSACHTKAVQYPTGKTVVWKSDDQLKDCTEIKVNPKDSQLDFTIIPTDNYMSYCINEVAVIIDDQWSTKYMKVPANKWRQGVSETFGLTKQ